MKQLIIALLLKMRDKYPEREKILNELLGELDKNFNANINWVIKSGVLNNKTSDLFERLDLESKEMVFTKLFKRLYPTGVLAKNPERNAWLLKIDNKKFFFDVSAGKVIIPMGEEEPRTFPAGEFFENMPKLNEFFNYLNDYSMRNRRQRFF